MPLSGFFAQLLHSLFQNPISALAQGNVLAVVVFSLLLGIALVVGGERYANIFILLQEFLELMLMLVGWIMRLAPFGIMALLVKLAATQDTALLGTLVEFVVVVVATTLLHGVVVLPLILYLVTGMTPLKFWRGAREALITAFATSSSSATLPVTLRCVEQHLHVKGILPALSCHWGPRLTWTAQLCMKRRRRCSSPTWPASNSTWCNR